MAHAACRKRGCNHVWFTQAVKQATAGNCKQLCSMCSWCRQTESKDVCRAALSCACWVANGERLHSTTSQSQPRAERNQFPSPPTDNRYISITKSPLFDSPPSYQAWVLRFAPSRAGMTFCLRSATRAVWVSLGPATHHRCLSTTTTTASLPSNHFVTATEPTSSPLLSSLPLLGLALPPPPPPPPPLRLMRA